MILAQHYRHVFVGYNTHSVTGWRILFLARGGPGECGPKYCPEVKFSQHNQDTQFKGAFSIAQNEFLALSREILRAVNASEAHRRDVPRQECGEEVSVHSGHIKSIP